MNGGCATLAVGAIFPLLVFAVSECGSEGSRSTALSRSPLRVLQRLQAAAKFFASWGPPTAYA